MLPCFMASTKVHIVLQQRPRKNNSAPGDREIYSLKFIGFQKSGRGAASILKAGNWKGYMMLIG